MRLNSIKLSGFKSFAEPTNFVLPGQLVGVVGPNGCASCMPALARIRLFGLSVWALVSRATLPLN